MVRTGADHLFCVTALLLCCSWRVCVCSCVGPVDLPERFANGSVEPPRLSLLRLLASPAVIAPLLIVLAVVG